jgi:hypothetical protein
MSLTRNAVLGILGVRALPEKTIPAKRAEDVHAGAPPDDAQSGEEASSKYRILEAIAVAIVFLAFAYQLLPIVRAPSLYPDSGTALSISRTLAHGDFGVVWSTQSPLIQDGMYALLLRLGSTEALHYPVAIATLGLVALLGYVAFRFTRIVLAAALPMLVLMWSDVLWHQSGYLTMYAGFALLGYAGLFIGITYLLNGGRWWAPVASAVLLTAALHTFTTALVFLVVPVLAAAVYWSRDRVVRTGILYAAIGLLVSPWLLWHLVVGGPSRLYYHPLNWFTEKYMDVVNLSFWGYDQISVWSYIRQMGSVGLNDVLPPLFLIFLFPGLWYVGREYGWRAAIFCGVALSAYLLVLVWTRPAPFARYYFPILPLLALLVSAGLFGTFQVLDRSRCGAPIARPALTIVVCMLGILPFLGHHSSAVSDAQYRFVDRLDSSVGYQDFLSMASIIEGSGSQAGIIARDSSMQALLPANQIYTHFLLTEDEYATFLAWQEEEPVADLLESRGVRWVLVHNDPRWERDYHLWLPAYHGVPVRHFEMIERSSLFRTAYAGRIYTLYEFTGSDAASQGGAYHEGSQDLRQ